MTEVDDHVAADDPSSAPSRPRSPRGGRSGLRWPAIVLPPLVLTAAIVLGIWYFISYAVLVPRRRFLLRPPHEVVANGFLDWDAFSEILESLWSSAKVAFIGLAIAVILGMAVAIAMSQTAPDRAGGVPVHGDAAGDPDPGHRPADRVLVRLRANSRVIVCVIISIFPIIANTLFGLQSADATMHDLFTLHQANRWTRLWKLMFPAALPAIFAGLRISAGLSVIGAIVGDFFFGQGDAGIGQACASTPTTSTANCSSRR